MSQLKITDLEFIESSTINLSRAKYIRGGFSNSSFDADLDVDLDADLEVFSNPSTGQVIVRRGESVAGAIATVFGPGKAEAIASAEA